MRFRHDGVNFKVRYDDHQKSSKCFVPILTDHIHLAFLTFAIIDTFLTY